MKSFIPLIIDKKTTCITMLPDGTCAMEFVHMNRIWNNPNYVNLFDVNKDAPWQYINFVATLFGQYVELLLINDRYVPSGLELVDVETGE